MRRAARVQSEQHQSGPGTHDPDAQGQAGAGRAPQAEAEPGQKETREGQYIHAKEHVPGQHRVI